MVFGARILLTSGGCPLFCKPIIVSAGVAVHCAALLIAALPLMGVGDYLFATDYCQYNVEGTRCRAPRRPPLLVRKRRPALASLQALCSRRWCLCG